MINKVILIGNLGKDPEFRTIENGTPVATFSMATSESYLDKSNEWQTVTEWHNVVAWRKLAESAQKNLTKGKQIYLEGKLTHRKYQDKEGQDRYTTEIVARVIRMVGSKESNGIQKPVAVLDGLPTGNVGGDVDALPF